MRLRTHFGCIKIFQKGASDGGPNGLRWQLTPGGSAAQGGVHREKRNQIEALLALGQQGKRGGMGQNGLGHAAVKRAPEHALEARWFAVQCQPHRENAAAEHLRRQGYRVFLPRQRRAVRHARRIETVLRPFFPGYLFVELDTARQCWRPINSTFGVARLVTAGERPAPAPVGIIETLRAFFDDAEIYDGVPDLVAGQRVRVVAGPLADLCGELVHLDARARVRVLLDVMGGSVPALLARGAVVPEEGCF